MIHAFVLAMIAALLLASVVRATRPSGLLAFAGGWHDWWQIMKPRWLPDKPTGGCAMCTAFWLPGFPVAVWAFAAAGWWCLVVPFIVGIVFEISISK